MIVTAGKQQAGAMGCVHVWAGRAAIAGAGCVFFGLWLHLHLHTLCLSVSVPPVPLRLLAEYNVTRAVITLLVGFAFGSMFWRLGDDR